MVFATLGTAGKSRKGWWAPCWAPRVVATFQHWGESGRPASKPSYPAREQAGRAPTYFPTLSTLPVLPSPAPLCIAALVNTVHTHTHTHTTQTEHTKIMFETFTRGQLGNGHTNILSKALHRLTCQSFPLWPVYYCTHTHVCAHTLQTRSWKNSTPV